ncbi:MAG: hypothetical protein ACRYG7_06730 [Janthinobacterium lividum]
MVQNKQPGDVVTVAAGEITGNVYLYRTTQGYDSFGSVAWAPQGGATQVQDLAPGETVVFAINGQAGQLGNGCPALVQALWDNAPARAAANVKTNAISKLLKADRRPARKAQTTRAVAAATDDPGQQAMQKLTAQWYNAVVGGLGLDTNTFQLVQGVEPLGTTSETLWNIFDAVPPLSVTSYYNSGQSNVFSSDYGAVLANLIPQNSNSFQNDMGDYYSQWTTYLATNPAMPATGGILQLFQNWSQMHMPPDQAQQCYTDYQQISQGTVPAAMTMWLAAGGATGAQKAYNATINQLKSALQSTSGKSFTMDSATASSDLSQTWAQADTSGYFDFFSGDASGQYSSLSQQMTSAGITIEADFQRVVTFTAAPLAKVSTDPILSQYQPWYSSAALNMAYQTPDNTVWRPTHPNWNDTFGPSGNMLRTTSALVVVDGVTITTTANTQFSSSDQQQFQAAVSGGFFPFFEASASGGWSHQATFSSSGAVTITSKSMLGNPIVLGASVTPIGGVLLL